MATMDVDQPAEAAEALPVFTLGILTIVRSAQAIHGLKHSEYSRYRYSIVSESFQAV